MSWLSISEFRHKYKILSLLNFSKCNPENTHWAIQTLNRLDRRQVYMRRYSFDLTYNEITTESKLEVLLSQLGDNIMEDMKTWSWIDTHSDRIFLCNRVVDLIRDTRESLEITECDFHNNLVYGIEGNFKYQHEEPWFFRSSRPTTFQLQINLDLIAFRFYPETRQITTSSFQRPFFVEPFYSKQI